MLIQYGFECARNAKTGMIERMQSRGNESVSKMGVGYSIPKHRPSAHTSRCTNEDQAE